MRYPSRTCMAKSTAYQTHDPLQTKEVNYRHGSRGHNFSLMGLATSILLVCIHDSINTCELLVLQAGCIGSKRYATASNKGQ